MIPDEIYETWNAVDEGKASEATWRAGFERYRTDHPALALEFERRMSGALPETLSDKADKFLRDVNAAADTVATRKASQQALEGYGPVLPELIGGSADLAGSNLTLWSGSVPVTAADASGNYIYFGVREFGMSALCNGIVLHGGLVPYCATFLVFSEYARNALRMAALMKIRSIFVYTHDSIGLGEDGPTHQAVEQTATLRLIPNMSLWRPCDTVETAVAWRMALERHNGPTCLLFSRQNLDFQVRDEQQIQAISRGGYVLRDCEGTPEAIIIATGSEVGLAVDAAARLNSQGRRVRVVSMPSTDVFDAQDVAYKESVLPPLVTARVAVEAGVTPTWVRYVGLQGAVVGIDSFGESAPAEVVFEHFGFTVDNVVATVEKVMTA